MGRCGISQPTANQLQFQLDHARARDAIKKPLDWQALKDSLLHLDIPLFHLHSRAHDRETYLQRPDLGRLLTQESANQLLEWRSRNPQPIDVCIAIADGLSATAIEQQAVPMLQQLLCDLKPKPYDCAAICLIEQGRVAISDQIGDRLNARFFVLLVGERPGLSSPNSLGIYFTYQARPGCTDAQRNCISNIRKGGLSVAAASERLVWLIDESAKLNESGIRLKDSRQDTGSPSELAHDRPGNFLLDTP